jgi:TorA maturation chaperone TorD
VDITSLTLGALRDFFIGPDAESLEAAARRLAALGGLSLEGQDWREVEYEFNRLFVGPAPPAAPPYASVYLENEPRLMAESTLRVRHFYQMLGRVSPWQDTLPDDHLSLELDVCVVLRESLLKGCDQELNGLYAYFMDEHLALWVPAFIEKVLGQSNLTRPIAGAIHLLADWLEYERSWLAPAALTRDLGWPAMQLTGR